VNHHLAKNEILRHEDFKLLERYQGICPELLQIYF